MSENRVVLPGKLQLAVFWTSLIFQSSISRVCKQSALHSKIQSTRRTLGQNNWATMRENMTIGFANNKGADQPAHPRGLISTFVISSFESIISKLATCKIF